MMKPTLLFFAGLFVFFLLSNPAWAQPANDDCTNAFDVAFSADEATVVLTNGDSRGATASTTPAIGGCSASFYTDDTWYKFTTPAILPQGSIVIRGYFGTIPSTDVTAIGMALYESCGASEASITCFSSSVPEDDRIELPAFCMLADHTYMLRVWSTGNMAATEGTFRIGVYPVAYPVDNVLWVDRFETNPFTRGWTTTGVCAINPDSSINAVWKYLPDGTIPAGAFTPRTTIPSETFCNGAVGVHSDFNDSKGSPDSVGFGSVPTALNATGSQSDPATYELMSPAIFIGDWGVSGISVTFHQGVRTLNSTFTLSFRNKNEDDLAWEDWTDIAINGDLVVNDPPTFNTIRLFMPDAQDADSLQLKLTYLAHYYFWMIDDFKIIETECNNSRVQSNFFAIAPWASVPANQVYPYAALADIYNAGSCPQTNTVLNYTLVDTASDVVVYNRNNLYGTIGPDSLAENKLFPELIELPKATAVYQGTYTLTTDAVDFDPSDNMITHFVNVGGNTFALEDGFTRSVAVNGAIYDPGAPLSYAYGNYFYAVEDVDVRHITWGVNNPADMAGKTVSIYLLQWTDSNGDRIAESNERRFVGYNDYTFKGTEGDNAILETVLENFDNPGETIIMQGGFGYLAMIEYVASLGTDPQFFMLASEARDYGAQVLAMDTAFEKGISDMRVYSSVLGFSPDGNIANIDYEVTELSTTDTRIFFGHDIVPLVRIGVGHIDNTKDELNADNLISIFPNPTSDQIHVNLEFAKPYRDVQLRLVNPAGQIVMVKKIPVTITNHTESISVHELPAGNYLLQVETVDGQRTIPFIVVK